MDKAKITFLLDILERVNRDPDLVLEIRNRADLEHPDLQVAAMLARTLAVEAGA